MHSITRAQSPVVEALLKNRTMSTSADHRAAATAVVKHAFARFWELAQAGAGPDDVAAIGTVARAVRELALAELAQSFKRETRAEVFPLSVNGNGLPCNVPAEFYGPGQGLLHTGHVYQISYGVRIGAGVHVATETRYLAAGTEAPPPAAQEQLDFARAVQAQTVNRTASQEMLKADESRASLTVNPEWVKRAIEAGGKDWKGFGCSMREMAPGTVVLSATVARTAEGHIPMPAAIYFISPVKADLRYKNARAYFSETFKLHGHRWFVVNPEESQKSIARFALRHCLEKQVLLGEPVFGQRPGVAGMVVARATIHF